MMGLSCNEVTTNRHNRNQPYRLRADIGIFSQFSFSRVSESLQYQTIFCLVLHPYNVFINYAMDRPAQKIKGKNVSVVKMKSPY